MSQIIAIDDLPTQDKIDHLHHPRAQYLKGFLEDETKHERASIMIDDVDNINEALQAGLTMEALYVSGLNTTLSQDFLQAWPNEAPLYEIAPRTCKKLFGKAKHSRVFAVAQLPDCHDSSVIWQQHGDVAVLDRLTIAGNMGAVIRSALAFGIGGIIVLDTHPVDIFDRRVIRASRGLVFRVPIAALTTSDFIEQAKVNNRSIVATSSHASQTLEQGLDGKQPLAIVIGSEKTGCSQELLDQAGQQVRIPMSDAVESLNVSVAASLLFYMRRYLLSHITC